MISLYDEMAETSRRQILAVLRSGPMTVNKIVEDTRLKQPNVSNHLARLKNRGIVISLKTGREVTYSLASGEIAAIVDALFSFGKSQRCDCDFEVLVQEFYSSLISGDAAAASLVLDQAFQTQSDILDIYERLISPAMVLVTNAVASEKIDDVQETLATEITLRMMARTVQVAGPAKRNGRSCVIGCAVSEWNVVGPRMAADLLRLSGWKSFFCGPNVPIRSFLTAVYQNRPDLVLIGCTSEESRPAALQLVRELNSLRINQKRFYIGMVACIDVGAQESLKDAGADFALCDLRKFSFDLIPAIDRQEPLAPEFAWCESQMSLN
jgi:methanogenic corrinoid protein MtbC1